MNSESFGNYTKVNEEEIEGVAAVNQNLRNILANERDGSLDAGEELAVRAQVYSGAETNSGVMFHVTLIGRLDLGDSGGKLERGRFEAMLEYRLHRNGKQQYFLTGKNTAKKSYPISELAAELIMDEAYATAMREN